MPTRGKNMEMRSKSMRARDCAQIGVAVTERAKKMTQELKCRNRRSQIVDLVKYHSMRFSRAEQQ